ARSAKGELDAALADYDEALRLNPPDRGAYIGDRGIAWFQKEEFDKAEADLTEAIRLEPKMNRFYTYRASCRQRSGDFDKATADLNEAVRLAPPDYFAVEDRARIWLALKQFDKSRADFADARRLNPKLGGLPENSVAWTLATHPDARFRDGTK